MWDKDTLEIRIIEAAYIEANLPRESFGHKPVKGQSLNVVNEFSDAVSGEYARDKEKWEYGSARALIPGDAIQRYEEMTYSIARTLPRRVGRVEGKILIACLWAWAFAFVGHGRNFRSWCRKAKIKPRTAYRHKEAAVKFLIEKFNAENKIISQSILTEVSHLWHKFDANQITSDELHSPRSTIQEKANSTASFYDEEAAQALSEYILSTNKKRQKARLKRAMRKVSHGRRS